MLARCAAVLVCVSCGGRAAPPVATPAPTPVVATAPVVAAPEKLEPIAGDAITVSVSPAPAYVEISEGAQLVNCDLVVTNTSPAAWLLVGLQVEVFDRKDQLGMRKFLDGNGVSPSITTIPNRELAANARLLILNPLFAFPRDLELARLRFTLTYEREGGDQQLVATAEVKPEIYKVRARLQLPVRGRVLIWDGHDFLSHHRRWDYVFEPIRSLGFTSTAARYSYDFIPVDERGDMVRGDASKNESWFGFGKPIYAPAAGTVVAVVDAHPDDRKFEIADLRTNLMAVYGNYLVIDHGHGEHSVFGHIQQASAKVALGARVVAGQQIAAIGASGSSHMPHLHYQLQTTADGHAEGLPSYFVDFVRVRGAKKIAVKQGQVDTGELLEARP